MQFIFFLPLLLFLYCSELKPKCLDSFTVHGIDLNLIITMFTWTVLGSSALVSLAVPKFLSRLLSQPQPWFAIQCGNLIPKPKLFWKIAPRTMLFIEVLFPKHSFDLDTGLKDQMHLADELKVTELRKQIFKPKIPSKTFAIFIMVEDMRCTLSY